MADKDLSKDSHKTKNKDARWYEQPKGICIVVQHRTPFINISWKTLRAAIARKDK